MTTESRLEHLLGNDDSLLTYLPLFHSHTIRADVFGELTDEDLIEMGVKSLGHRIKIMKLVRSYAESKTQPKQETSPSSPSFTHNLSNVSSKNNSSSSLALAELPDIPRDETLALRQRLDSYERQIKRLNEQIVRLRTDLLRKSKESEPLPTPTLRHSPATTPSGPPQSASQPSANQQRRPSQESYFSHKSGNLSATMQSSASSNASTVTITNGNSGNSSSGGGGSSSSNKAPKGMANINIAAANKAAPSSFSAINSMVRPVSIASSVPAFSPPINLTGFPGKPEPNSSGGSGIPKANPLNALPNVNNSGQNSGSATAWQPMARTSSNAAQPPPQPTRTTSAPQVPTTQQYHRTSIHSPHQISPTSGKFSPSLPPLSSTRIELSSNADPLNKLRCSEHDNTVAVLTSMAKIYKLEGDINQWRLQLIHGETTRDLLDHEHPLVIYKQMQESGTAERLTFQARKIVPTKPPTYGNFI